MSRRSPPALPPQPEDPVPVEEHDSDDGDGGASTVDAWPASLHFSSMSPPPSAWDWNWETMIVPVGHLTPSPPRSPSPLWNFDGEQRLPQQMGPTANCSAAVLEAAPQDTSYGFTTSKTIFLHIRMLENRQATIDLQWGLMKMEEDMMKIEDDEKIYICLPKNRLSRGLETHMSTETGGSSLAMTKSYDDDNELGDNDAEQTEISRRHPRNSSRVWLHATKVGEELKAAITGLTNTFSSLALERTLERQKNAETGRGRLLMIESYDDKISRTSNILQYDLDLTKFTMTLARGMSVLKKTLKSYGLEIYMNIENGRSSFAMIESYDDDNKLGDNDAEQSEISRKRPRSRSLVWLHFIKVLSKDSGMVTAMCERCYNTLTGASTSGTSHLLRHLKKAHQIDLSSLSQAWKEPQGSSCPQKLQITGSAACAGSTTPLTENNGNEIELQEKDFELGDTSKKRRKGTSRKKSNIWHHFTKLPSADSGGVRAKCNYCETTLKAGSQNGTSTLWRHVKKNHEEKVCQEGS